MVLSVDYLGSIGQHAVSQRGKHRIQTLMVIGLFHCYAAISTRFSKKNMGLVMAANTCSLEWISANAS